MANGTFISYLRVSTAEQGKSGLGLEAQREAVNGFLNGGRHTLVREFVEVESGKRSDNRPALQKALTLCRAHQARLIVAKLDRLARNVHFVSGLRDSGVKFVACDMPDATELTVNLLASVAQDEARAISARTKAALAAAKARGTKLGGLRWNITADVQQQANRASAKARAEKANKRAADLSDSIRDAIKTAHAKTFREIAAVLNNDKVPTPSDAALMERGLDSKNRKWSAMQVSRIRDRVKVAAPRTRSASGVHVSYEDSLSYEDVRY
jgi:DNA invertase Pin-like site-specific DNA recombinase